jgi:hypothetical protein
MALMPWNQTDVMTEKERFVMLAISIFANNIP